jgi:diphthine-ammonia ligase
MSARPRAAISWSGGKDCCSALLRVADRYEVAAALTMFDEGGARSRSHGLRPELVAAQVGLLGLAHVSRRTSWDAYTEAFESGLAELAAGGITHVIFGDIMFDSHREWTEQRCASAGMTAVQPIWGEPTDRVVREFLDSGSEAVIVTARAQFLDRSWLGRPLNVAMLDELAALGVDPCGEHGEYHTLVVNCPLFSRPLAVRPCGDVLHAGCWALDLELVPDDRRRD